MKIGITGGAGFIGHHAARAMARRGFEVTLLDNFSRPGGRENVRKLSEEFGDRLRVVEADIRHVSDPLRDFVISSDVVLHFAAQVAVTLSVRDPRADFETNALGTLNLLEACRERKKPPVFIYSSTNKVYGGMETTQVGERDGRYGYVDLPHGVSELQQLDFHSPYGCSKGAADQYVRDYSRIFGIPTVVLRQSCIYGAEQYGMEDQGWVAHITLQACLGRPVKIFGDGKQVRDVLYIDDLVDLYERCMDRIDSVQGQVFNIGGGPENTLSLLELVAQLETQLGRKLAPTFHDWRPGDQKVFVCDVRTVEKALGWKPTTSPEAGIRNLLDWIGNDRHGIERVLETIG